MEKLELKNLAPYLPYGLKIWNIDMGVDFDLTIQEEDEGIDIESILYSQSNWKLILRPLSDLTKEIEVNGEKFIPLYKLIKEDKAFTTDFIYTFGYEELKVSVYELLLEWHFDVFGLIEKGLAIDINTLNREL